MSAKTSMTWTGGMSFDAVTDGHHIIMDAGTDWGGQDLGPRPKPLLLIALSGCSGMDVVSLLEKMRVGEYRFRVDVEADSTSDYPVTYHTIRAGFHFWGDNLPPEKILKAVKLSMERYCGVHAMLAKAANIMVKTYINDEEVKE
ncbi:MAG: OsmC family protein [Candidatus Cloacimonetes bacterium]|nr:OsmC family protein [Candidatus Cloacimonadota bacterium]